MLPNGRELPLEDWARPVPCPGCGVDLGAWATVRLSRGSGRPICPPCWVAERCGVPAQGAEVV